MKVTIDGRELEARDGETVIALAHRHGIEIPHFCWHERLSIAGNCRLCLVKVEGLPRLTPACNLVAMPDMKVETAAPEVERARRHVMQLLLVNHPVDCGICDKAGECRLQDHQHRYGPAVSAATEPRRRGPKLVELSERISLDNERCILCSRCVRFTREVSRSGALGLVERGGHARVERVGALPFDDPYSDNVIGLCPTGALLSREFMYRSRVWFLEPVRSVCTGCARCCSIHVWRRRAERVPSAAGMPGPRTAWRTTACDNPAINGPWICNKGFDQHRTMARERVLAATVEGQPADAAHAVAALRALLAGARRPAALVSTHAANEELDAFAAALGARLQVYVREELVAAAGEVREDALLIHADKNPNRAGVRARFGERPYASDAGHDLLLAWGEFPPGTDFAPVPVVHLATFAPALPRARVVVPLSITLERAGSFTNCAGHANAFAAVFEPPPGVWHAAELFARLAP